MTDTLDAIAREMETACPGYAGPDAEYSVDASRVWAWAQALRKITTLSNQGEGLIGFLTKVDGSEPRQVADVIRADTNAADFGVPDKYVQEAENYAQFLLSRPAEADRRDADGDWFADQLASVGTAEPMSDAAIQMARDSAHYRWVKDNCWFNDWRGGGITLEGIGLDIDWKNFNYEKACAVLDAAIDAAIAATQEQT